MRLRSPSGSVPDFDDKYKDLETIAYHWVPDELLLDGRLRVVGQDPEDQCQMVCIQRALEVLGRLITLKNLEMHMVFDQQTGAGPETGPQRLIEYRYARLSNVCQGSMEPFFFPDHSWNP